LLHMTILNLLWHMTILNLLYDTILNVLHRGWRDVHLSYFDAMHSHHSPHIQTKTSWFCFV